MELFEEANDKFFRRVLANANHYDALLNVMEVAS